MKKGQLGADETFVMDFFQARYERLGKPVAELFKIFDPPYNSFSSEFVQSAKVDLNQDGFDELIVIFEHMFSCGSGGCDSYIFRKVDGGWIEIADFSGLQGVELAEPIIDGWPRVYSHEACLVWKGGRYKEFNDDPFEMGVDPECRR